MRVARHRRGAPTIRPEKQKRQLSLKKKLLFSSVVTLTILTVVITALELFGYSQQPVFLGGLMQESFELNHRWRPNSEFVHDEFIASNPDFPQPYTHLFNSQGWLETYEVQKAKPPNTYRIFYLGDSFTEGTAPMDQNVPSVVESELNRVAANKALPLRFEVINTGCSSYSPLIFYVLLRNKVLDYSPDLIVIQVDMTDDFDDWKYHKSAIYDEQGNPWAMPPRNVYESAYFDSADGVVKASMWSQVQLFLVRNSHFYNYLLGMRKTDDIDKKMTSPRQNDGVIYNRWSWCKPEWDVHTQKNARRTLDTLTKITVLCKQRGVKLMLTGVPHYRQFASSYTGDWPPLWSNRPHIEIGKIAKAAGVAYLDSHAALLPLIKGTPQESYYFHRNMHFNPRGYAVWARAQLSLMLNRQSNLLPLPMY